MHQKFMTSLDKKSIINIVKYNLITKLSSHTNACNRIYQMASHNFPYPGFPTAHPSPLTPGPNIDIRPLVLPFHPLPNEGGRSRSMREDDVVRKFAKDLTKLVPKQMPSKIMREHVTKLDSVISDLVSLREIREVCTVPINPEEVISSIAWSQPGYQHFALAYNTKIRLYNYKQTLESGAISQYLCCPFEEVKAESQVLSLAFQNSQGNCGLASGEKDGTVSLWRYEESGLPAKLGKDTIEKMQSNCWTLCWVPGSTMLGYGGQDCIIRVCECVTKVIVRQMSTEASVNALLPMSQNLLVAGTSSNSIPIFDLRSPTIQRGCLKREVHGVCALSGVMGAEFEVLSASKDSTISLWDLRMLRLVNEYRGHKNEDKFVGLSNNGKFIAVGTEDDSIALYHKEISSPVMCYSYPPGNMGFVRSVSFHEDGRHLIAGNSTGNVKILTLDFEDI